MLAEPKLERRAAKRSVGIREVMPMNEIAEKVGKLFDEMAVWVEQRGLKLNGAPFIRYHVIDMDGDLEIEVGYPVDGEVSGDNRVEVGTIPTGRYLTAIYTGDYPNLMGATADIMAWAEQHKVAWDVHGNMWGGRFEFYITDPMQEPDSSKWQTEIAILTA